MKVAQLAPEMEVGGVERGTVEITRALVAAGHSAYVVSAGGRLTSVIEGAGGRHITMPIGSKNPMVAAACIPKIRRLIRDERVDIVHARSRVPAWVGYFATGGSHAHFITTAHGFYRPHWISRSMVMGEKVIAVSHPLKQYLIEKFGVAESRIVVIHRGVDTAEFHERAADEVKAFLEKWFIPPGGFVVGMVGRPSPVKGHAILLDAIKRLINSGVPIHAIFVGVEPDAELAEPHPCIKFIRPMSDVALAYSAMDLCVMPSTVPEAFGRTVIEAMACRRPVIASNLGGVLDIIENGSNGLLFPAGDAGALADRISLLFHDSALRSRLADAGYQTVLQKFTLGKYISATLQLYQQILTK
ncbi:MAG: glycosyltransferase family 4 protein [bacterium]